MLLGLVMVVAFMTPTSAAVFRVPDDSPSIQKALSTAHAGDTVLVAPGIYYESLTMQPGVHLHGQPGAILDGSQTFSPVVRALPGIDHTAILSGFVIRRGQQAGLFLNRATLTIRNNVIIDNLGPGVVCAQASPRLINNIIARNAGGGIVCQYPETAPVITYNNVWQNQPADYLGCTPTEGNRSQEPGFVQAQQGDYRLREDSPLRDAGHPAVEFNDPDGSRSDLGIAGGPQPQPPKPVQPLLAVPEGLLQNSLSFQGLPGIIDIPTATMVPPGSFDLEYNVKPDRNVFSGERPGRRGPGRRVDDQQNFTFAIGLLPRLTIGGLQRASSRPLGHHVHPLAPARVGPVQGACQPWEQGLLDQLPGTPPRRRPHAIQVPPTRPHRPSHPFVDQQCIEHLAMQPQVGQRTALPGPQGIEIEQALAPFDGQFYLPSHAIELQQGLGTEDVGRQRGPHQHPPGQEQGASLGRVALFAVPLATHRPGFVGLLFTQTIRMDPARHALGRGAHSHWQAVQRTGGLLLQRLEQVQRRIVRLGEGHVVGIQPHDQMRTSLDGRGHGGGMTVAPVGHGNVVWPKGKAPQTFAGFGIADVDMRKLQRHEVQSKVQAVVDTVGTRGLHRAPINDDAPPLWRERRQKLVRDHLGQERLDPRPTGGQPLGEGAIEARWPKMRQGWTLRAISLPICTFSSWKKGGGGPPWPWGGKTSAVGCSSLVRNTSL